MHQTGQRKSKDPCDEIKEQAGQFFEGASDPKVWGSAVIGGFLTGVFERVGGSAYELSKHTAEHLFKGGIDTLSS